jgi:hypothetical protein
MLHEFAHCIERVLDTEVINGWACRGEGYAWALQQWDVEVVGVAEVVGEVGAGLGGGVYRVFFR